MHTTRFLGLLAAVLPTAGCLGEASLVGPEPAETGGDPARAARGSEMRIIIPANNTTMKAGANFAIRVLQEMRGEPVQGRAQVQYSANAEDWTDLGLPFAWTSQAHEFQSPPVAIYEPGRFAIRLAVCTERSQTPSLMSHHVTIRCLTDALAEGLAAGR